MMGFPQITNNIENNRTKLRRIARHDDQEFSNQSILNAMEKFVKTVNAMDETILVPSRLMDCSVGDSTDTPSSSLEPPKHLTFGKKKAGVRERLKESDLFTLYNMLNSVKVDLLWGRNDEMPLENDGDLTPIVETEKLLIDEVQATITNTTTNSTISNVASIPINAESPKTVDSQSHSQQSGPTQYQLSVTSSTINDASGTKGHIRRPSTVSTISTNSAASTISDTDSEVSNENDSGIESETNQDRDKSIELAKQFRTHLHGLYKCLEQMTDAAHYLTVRYQNDVGTV